MLRPFAIALTILSNVSLCRAVDLIVSANDGKFVRVDGGATFPTPAPSDSLAIIDAEQTPPKLKAVVEGLEHTVQGPPQAVAITPDGSLVIVGAPSRYDYATGVETLDTFLQVVDLDGDTAKFKGKVDVGAHVNGLAISPDGSLLLAAGLDGKLYVFAIRGKDLSLVGSVKVSASRLAGVTFTHDGKAAIVTMRDEGGAAVLDVADAQVSLTSERISTGVAPYTVEVSSDGKWAVISNVGLAGLVSGKSPGDADSLALVDVSKRPFRTVQYLTVPATPEDATISPDGKWIVAQSLGGSNLAPSDPGWNKRGRLTLFSLSANGATKVNDLPDGTASQGVVFAKNSRSVIVQNDVERELAVFEVTEGLLRDTGERIPLAAGPVSIRSMPR